MSLALDDLRLNRENGVVFLIRETSAEPPDRTEKNLDLLRNKNPNLFEDFITKNSSAIIFDESFCVAPACFLKDEKEAKDTFFNLTRRKTVAGQFPNLESSIGLSRVGFDREGKRALIYARRFTGPKSGLGEYITFESQSGKWMIQNRFEAWLM